MYEVIAKHPNPREVYSKLLMDRGDIDAQLAKEMDKSFWKQLQDRLDFVKQNPLPYTYQEPELAWKNCANQHRKILKALRQPVWMPPRSR